MGALSNLFGDDSDSPFFLPGPSQTGTDDYSFLGALGNLWSESKAIGKGIGGLALQPLHDADLFVRRNIGSTATGALPVLANLALPGIGATVSESLESEAKKAPDDRAYATDDLLKQAVFDWSRTAERDERDDRVDSGFWNELGEDTSNVLSNVMPAAQSDIIQRYGALVPRGLERGSVVGRGAGEVGRELYEHPLSAITDVLGVAFAGGKAASAGASAAFPRVMPGLAALDAGGTAGPLARTVAKIHPGAPERAAQMLAGETDDLAWLGGVRKTMRSTGKTETGGIVYKNKPLNPTRRYAGNLANRLASQKVGKSSVVLRAARAAGATQEEIRSLSRGLAPMTEEAGQAILEQAKGNLDLDFAQARARGAGGRFEVADEADDIDFQGVSADPLELAGITPKRMLWNRIHHASTQEGVERIYKPMVDARLLRKATDNAITGHSNRHMHQRQAENKDMQGIVRRNGVGGDPTLHHVIQRENNASYGRLELDDVEANYSKGAASELTPEQVRALKEGMDYKGVSRDGTWVELPSAINKAGLIDAAGIAEKVARSLDGQLDPSTTSSLAVVNTPTGQVSVRMQTARTARHMDVIDDDLDRIRVLRDDVAGAEAAIRDFDVNELPPGTDEMVALGRLQKAQARAERKLMAAERVVRDLTDGMLADQVYGVEGFMSESRVWIHRNISQRALRRGDLDYETILNRAYRPKVWNDHGPWEGLEKRAPWTKRWLKENADELEAAELKPNERRLAAFEAYDDWFEEQKGTAQWIERWDQDHANGIQTPLYFPHFDPRRLKTSDYLMTYGAHGMETKARPSTLKENQLYLMANDLYDKDVPEILARVAAQHNRYDEILDLSNHLVKEFGRKVTHHDQVAEGEGWFSPKLQQILFQDRKEMEGSFVDHMTSKENVGEDWAQTFDEVLPGQEQRAAVLATGESELVAMPKAVLRQIEGMTRYSLGTKGQIWWDTPTNVWRALVLAGSPRWLMNNVYGNTIFGVLQDPMMAADVLHQVFSPRYRRMLQDAIPEDELMRVEGGFFDQVHQYVAKTNLHDDNSGMAAVLTRNWRKGKGIGQGARVWGETARKFNSSIEDTFRRSSYVSGMRHEMKLEGIKRTGNQFFRSSKMLDQIADQGLKDPAMAGRAVDQVNKFFNDYKALSPVERKVVRRFFAPFYSFYKHTATLLARLPFEHPGRTIMLRSLTDVSNEMMAQLGPQPGYMEGQAVPIAPGSTEGSTRFLTASGINPFGGMFSNPLSMLHPFAQAGFELITGRSAVTGEDLSNPNVETPFGSSTRFYRDPETGEVQPITEGPNLSMFAESVPATLSGLIPQYGVGKNLVAEGMEQLGVGHGAGARYGTGQIIPDETDSGAPLFPVNAGEIALKYLGIEPSTDRNLLQYQQGLLEDQEAAEKLFATRP